MGVAGASIRPLSDCARRRRGSYLSISPAGNKLSQVFGHVRRAVICR